MAPLVRTLATFSIMATLSACTSPLEQIAATPPPAAVSAPSFAAVIPPSPVTPATSRNAEIDAEIAELEAGFAQLREKQDVMLGLMTALLQEATRPEVLAALKQSAERMKVATQTIQ